jgi:hypothetical protein
MGHLTLIGQNYDELIKRSKSARNSLVIRGDTPQ